MNSKRKKQVTNVLIAAYSGGKTFGIYRQEAHLRRNGEGGWSARDIHHMITQMTEEKVLAIFGQVPNENQVIQSGSNPKVVKTRTMRIVCTRDKGTESDGYVILWDSSRKYDLIDGSTTGTWIAKKRYRTVMTHIVPTRSFTEIFERSLEKGEIGLVNIKGKEKELALYRP